MTRGSAGRYVQGSGIGNPPEAMFDMKMIFKIEFIQK